MFVTVCCVALTACSSSQSTTLDTATLDTTAAPVTTFGEAIVDPVRTYCQTQLGEVRETDGAVECVLGEKQVLDAAEFAELGAQRATLLDLGRGVEAALAKAAEDEETPYAPAWSWEEVLRSPVALRNADVVLEDGETGEFHTVRTAQLGVVVGEFQKLFPQGVSRMELREGREAMCARFGEREVPAVWSYGPCK
jgi:hypothetical protein